MSTHEINLALASGASLKFLYFTEERQIRWIFDYHYIGEKKPGAAPDIVNKVKLVAAYNDGLLADHIFL